MVHPGRIVHFEGTDNFRDLGGYRNEQGKEIKWGLIYRAGKLSQLTEDDHEIFSALQIKTVVDFRRHDEIAEFPDNLPSSYHLNYIHLPVVSGVNGLSIVEDLLRTGKKPKNINGEELMRKANKYYVSKAREQCAKLMALLQNERNLPLVFHCSAGKDRTGFAAALLLFALGIPRETILEDYLLSNECRNINNNLKLDKLKDNASGKLMLKSLLEVKRDYLDSAYQEIDMLYGSVKKYLEQGLRLGYKDMDSLRDKFLQ